MPSGDAQTAGTQGTGSLVADLTTRIKALEDALARETEKAANVVKHWVTCLAGHLRQLEPGETSVKCPQCGAFEFTAEAPE